MAIRFVIDSASDLQPEEAQAMGVVHIPMSVTFGDREYRDTVDLTHKEFYEKLIESDTLPVTSQVTPGTYQKIMEDVTWNGDTAIVITMSSKLSGTYQSAVIAAENFPGRVYVVDSENVCVGERLLLLRGLALEREGKSAEEIVDALNAERKSIRVLALLDTLEYLKKGGRISATVAFAGSLLSIKPVVAVEEGEVVMAGKARGSKNGSNLLRELVNKCGGIDYSKPYCLAYSGLSDAMLQKYIADNTDLWQSHARKLPVCTVGCVIGTHVGPGAIAVAFFQN